MGFYTATLDIKKGPHKGNYEQTFDSSAKARDWIRREVDRLKIKKSEHTYKVVPVAPPLPPLPKLPDISEAFPGHSRGLNAFATPYHAFTAPRQ